jgi:hypothetical protein
MDFFRVLGSILKPLSKPFRGAAKRLDVRVRAPTTVRIIADVSEIVKEFSASSDFDRHIENKTEEIEMSVSQVVEPRVERLAARDLKRLSIEIDCSDSPSRANSAGKLYREIPAPATDVEAPHPGDDSNPTEKRRRRWRKDASQNAQSITALFSADMNVMSLRHAPPIPFLAPQSSYIAALDYPSRPEAWARIV